jgi:hypothetical protein
MTLFQIIYKIKKKSRSIIITHLLNKTFYPKIYKSYWHGCSHKPVKARTEANYYSAVPNRGAGIGHQMANWITGYWFARQFGLKFAHIPFAQEKWESFLGFGENEMTLQELIKKRGYKKILLPLFNEFKPDEVSLVKKIINAYSDQRVVFVAEQDQGYRDQFGIMEDLKKKFYNANARKYDRFIYTKDTFNIAIHVRRGDIVAGQKNQNLMMRWQDNTYFEKVLSTVVNNLKTDRPISIYFFSQGSKSEFSNFEKFSNIHFCMDMEAQDSFLHMVFADLLITSKSSFSYKPALLNNGIKVCPNNFWHGYPKIKNWILVEEDATFNVKQLNIN